MASKPKILFSILGICVIGAIIFVALPQNIKKSVRWKIKRQYLILTGGMINVGGHYLRIECQGKGSPTVIMDSGLNMPMNTWESVPQEVAKFTRVCIYERAGIGESDASTQQLRTSKDAVADLNELLQNAGENAPFILVGHSFGGLNIRLYSNLYPPNVAALVLVDSSHPDQYQRFANLKNPAEREKYLRHESGENRERMDLLASADEIKNAPLNSSIPLIVLSTENENPDAEEKLYQKEHQDMQIDLSRLSSKGKLIVVKNSGHFIQKDQPAILIENIKNLYEASKQNSNK